MQTTWIVAADSSRARVLQVAGRKHELVEIQDFINPGGRAADRELITDAHPRFRGTSGPGSDRQETSAVEHEVDLFSKRVGRFLDQARSEHRFDRLYLAAPPKFLGLLRRNLGKEVEKLVSEELDKDLSWLSVPELEKYVARESGRAP